MTGNVSLPPHVSECLPPFPILFTLTLCHLFLQYNDIKPVFFTKKMSKLRDCISGVNEMCMENGRACMVVSKTRGTGFFIKGAKKMYNRMGYGDDGDA